jgi:hypothetical protein
MRVSISQKGEEVPQPVKPDSAAPLHAIVFQQVSPERERCEKDLLVAGVPLALPHRAAWARAQRSADSWFLAVRDGSGTCRGGFAVEVHRSRALPGHLVLRADRLGTSLAGGTANAALAALANLARRNPQILRVNVELFARDTTVRQELGRALATFGFRRAESRRYTSTPVVDLTPSEDVVFASLSSTARRHIRAASKNPVAIDLITKEAFTPRLRELETETMRRTGGDYWRPDWPAVIRLSNTHPELSRLVGLFRTDAATPNALLAFAWGCHHGDHGQYIAGGSTRETDLRVPLAYTLMWDLLGWARRKGGRWFDLAGTTPGQQGSGDPLGGISDFKRRFSKTVVEVSEEWKLEPHPARAILARTISACAGWITRARRA